MIKKTYVIVCVILLTSILTTKASVTLTLQNATFPTTSSMTVDVMISTNSNFTLGGNRSSRNSFLLFTISNPVTDPQQAGQMEMTSLTNVPSGYTTSFVDYNDGDIEITLFKAVPNFAVTSTTTLLMTLNFTLSTGTTTAHSSAIEIDNSGITVVKNSTGVVQTPVIVNNLSTQTLPISLLKFDLRASHNKTQLDWITGMEKDNKGFEIQRSNDGLNFTSIGFVSGYGNSFSEKAYNFTDMDVILIEPHLLYYRLKQIDFDGAFIFTPTRTISFELDESLTWFPNPATDLITVQSDESQLIDIYDISGKTVLSTSTNESNNIDLTSLQKGTYLLLIKNMNGEIIQQDKLFIQ